MLGFFGFYPSKLANKGHPILWRRGPKNPTFFLYEITPNGLLMNYRVLVFISGEPRVDSFII